MTKSKIALLVERAESDPRVRAILENTFDFLEAEAELAGKNSPEARSETLGLIRHLWVDVLGPLNGLGAISSAYLNESAQHNDTKREAMQRITATLLLDAFHSFNNPVEGFERPVGQHIGAVAGELINLLEGRATTGVFKPAKAGRNGPRPAPYAVLGAWRRIIPAVYYLAGRDGLILREACEHVGVGYRAFQENRKKVLETFDVGAAEFRAAKSLGKASVSGNEPMPENLLLAKEFEAALPPGEEWSHLWRVANNTW